MNVLITGSSGFVGHNLVVRFKDTYSIFGVDITSKSFAGIIKEFVWDDLDIIPSIDVIIHLAGKAHDSRNAVLSHDYFQINVELTKRIFSYFLSSTAQKFIFFSSVKAVADSIFEKKLTENKIANPQTLYGKSKLEAECYLLNQQLPEGKKLYILRPCMIHGPGNKGNLNLLYKLLQNGLPWPLGAFENKRSYTSIGNLLFVIQQVIEKDIKPGTYQLADDEPLSTNELIRLIADSINKKTKIWNVSPIAINVLAKIGDVLGLPLNSERLKKLTESYVVANRKLKNALGIRQMPFTAIDGMKLTLESFKNRTQ